MKTIRDILVEAFHANGPTFRNPRLNKTVVSAEEIEANGTSIQHDIIHALNILSRHNDEFRNKVDYPGWPM